jgi:hypothetical protein
MIRLLCAMSIAVVSAAPLGAQTVSTRPGPGGPLTVDLSDGEPISHYLEISRELGLTDAQRTRLMTMRRQLRALNAPFMKQLDSLRDLAGVELGERGSLTADDREAIQRFREWARPVVDSIRVNNDAARAEVRAMLTAQQRATADSIGRGVGVRRPDRSDRRPGAQRRSATSG